MLSTSRKSRMAALLLQGLVVAFVAAGCDGVVAKFSQGNRVLGGGAVQRRHEKHPGWGLKPHAKLLSVSKRGGTTSLDSFLMQVRGGSNYDSDYYNNNNNRRGTSGGSGSGGGYYPDDDGYDSQGFDSREWGDNRNNNDYPDDYQNEYSSSRRYDDYDDRGRSSSRSSGSSNAVHNSFSSIQSKIKNGDRRLGSILLGMGAVFTILGVSLFFNKALMRLGNLSFIAGVPVFIGPSRTAGYFFKPEKIRATACLGAGIFLVFIGWPIFGIVLEVFGLLNLFGNMFPIFWPIIKNLPIVSSLTSGSSGNGGGGGGGRRRQQSYSYEDDPYGDDSRGYGDYGDDDAERYY